MFGSDKICMPMFESPQHARGVQVLEKGPLCCHPSMVGNLTCNSACHGPCGSFRRRNGLHLQNSREEKEFKLLMKARSLLRPCFSQREN